MFHQTLVKFYLIEGSLVNIASDKSDNHPYYNFSVAISNREGLQQFLSEYVESDCFLTSILTIKNAWLCKTYVVETVSLESLNNVQLNNFLWTENNSSLVEQINTVICHLKMDLDSLTNLVNGVNMANYNNIYQWILVETTKRGKPFRCGALSLETVETFNLQTNQVVSIYDDFTFKTLVYSIYGEKSDSCNFFTQNIVVTSLTISDNECTGVNEDASASASACTENENEIILINIEDLSVKHESILWSFLGKFKFW